MLERPPVTKKVQLIVENRTTMMLYVLMNVGHKQDSQLTDKHEIIIQMRDYVSSFVSTNDILTIKKVLGTSCGIANCPVCNRDVLHFCLFNIQPGQPMYRILRKTTDKLVLYQLPYTVKDGASLQMHKMP